MLIGLGKMVKKVVQQIGNLLASKVLGFTHVTVPGGSGYYTTTTTTGVNRYISIRESGFQNPGWYSYQTYALFTDGITGPWEFRTFPRMGFWAYVASNGTKTLVFEGENASSNKVLVSTDLITWTEQEVQANIGRIHGADYHNGYFTIIAEDGIWQSKNGDTWTHVFSHTFSYNDGGYVISHTQAAPGDGGYLFIGHKNFNGDYSSANIIACGRNISGQGEWYAGRTIPGLTVAHLNGIFMTDRGYRVYSPNYNPFGLDSSNEPAWTQINSIPNSNNGFTTIASAFGKFFWVAPSSSSRIGGTIFTSTDGETWTEQLVNGYYGSQNSNDTVFNGYATHGLLTFDGERLVYGSGRMYASVATSADGSTWTYTGLPAYSGYSTTGALAKMYSLKTVQIQTAIGNQGTTGAEILAPVDVYTVPALTETSISSVKLKNQSLNQMTYDLGVLNSGVSLTDLNALINDKAVGAGVTDTVSTISQTLTEGQKITVLPSAVDVLKVDIYGTETKLPVFVVGTIQSNNPIKYSANGLAWITANGNGGQYLKYHNGIFTGSNFSGQVWSEDAINWTFVPTSRPYMVSMYGEKYLAWNSTGGYTGLTYSLDGKTWTEVETGLDYKYIYFLNNKYLATLSNGNIAYSSDGISWTQKSLSLQYNFQSMWNGRIGRSITYGNGKFVIAGSNNFAYSEDGINWTELSFLQLQSDQQVTSIVFFNNMFRVLGTNVYGYSSDGINWTFENNTSRSFAGIANNILFTQTGQNLYYTEDGITFNSADIYFPGVIDICYANGNYVILDTLGVLHTSVELGLWTDRTLSSKTNDIYTGISYRP